MDISARMQKKLWSVRPSDSRASALAEQLKISPIVAQVLINRQITDSDLGACFLNPKLADLILPEKMPGITQAVDRIKKAVTSKEKITIYGDYDVDGITGVSILHEILKLLNADVDYYIPHRIEEGYGLNVEAIDTLAKLGTKLLISVDCGINALDSAEFAAKLGMDMIITDHHQPDPQLPKVLAIVHPALDPSYPNQFSCGATVAFKLAWALAKKFNPAAKLTPDLRNFMLNATSLAAMGTIADVVHLTGENRIITTYGLKTLAECKLHGIKALIETANLTGKDLDSMHIGFRLAPILNAAGRMGHARLAVELLTSQTTTRAMQIAEYLKSQNDQRRLYERKIFKEACEMIVDQNLHHPDNKSIVLANNDWHSGVIGIVASRIVEKYYRPTIIINTENGFAQGSARSIEGFDLLKAITSCSRHLRTFGGHKMAAGITLDKENITSFAADIESYAKENLGKEDVVNKLDIDAEVPFSQFTNKSVTELASLGPFGQGNPEPVFVTRGIRLVASPRTVGQKAEHLQITVTDNTATMRCIGFDMGAMEKKLLEHEFFSIAYKPQFNTFNNNTTIQLVLVDMQFE